MTATTNSTTKPKTTKPPQKNSRFSHHSDADSKSFSEALFMLGIRRHGSAKTMRFFWAGIGVAALILLLLMALAYIVK
jgi:hypothetical protein